jgi:hypothetical protein
MFKSSRIWRRVDYWRTFRVHLLPPSLRPKDSQEGLYLRLREVGNVLNIRVIITGTINVVCHWHQLLLRACELSCWTVCGADVLVLWRESWRPLVEGRLRPKAASLASLLLRAARGSVCRRWSVSDSVAVRST